MADRGREEGVYEGSIDYSDDGGAAVNEGDRDAGEWEKVDVVYGTVEGVDAPGWRGRWGDEVLPRGGGRIALFADKGVGGVGGGDSAFDELFDFCGTVRIVYCMKWR